MSGRETDLDALFERDADSRLLERRRRDELGLAAHVSPSSSTPARFTAESILETPTAFAPRPALLRLAVDARPDRGLIPGAMVTVVVSVHDDGDAPIPAATLRVSLPPEAEPVEGSFALDDVPTDGGLLLGAGLPIGAISPAGAARVRFVLRVLPGAAPLDVHVHAAAPGVPAVAPPVLRLQRRSGHTAYETARPFYELETGEPADEPAAIVVPAPPAPAPIAVDALLDAPAHPPVVSPLPPRAAQAFSPPSATVPPPPIHADVLVRRIDLDDVRALQRVYAGGIPHGLAHLALLCSLAAADGPLGEALGLAQFARSVASALPRALVAAKIGRTSLPVVTAEALATLHPTAPAPPPGAALPGTYLLLRLDARELDALRGVLGRSLDDPFLRGAQVLLGIAPRELEGVCANGAAAVRDAFERHRTAAGAWLMRVTIRRAVDRRFDPLTAPDPGLHESGKVLVAALHEALDPALGTSPA
jgi:hypothetical protein